MNESKHPKNVWQVSRLPHMDVSPAAKASPQSSIATIASVLVPWNGQTKAPEGGRTPTTFVASLAFVRVTASWSAAALCRFRFQGGPLPFAGRIQYCVLTLALFIFTTVTLWAKGPAITAVLEPTEIALGDSAQLTVTVNGQHASAPQIPPVQDLSFQHVGQSSEYQMINGAMSASVAHTYLVTTSRPGTFTIPKLRVGNGADAAESNPLVLKVLKRAGAATAQPNGSAVSPNLPAPAVNGASEDLPSVGRNEIGFLRIVAPKREFLVGEMVPVELKAYFRAGVELRVDGLPQLSSDAFTMNKLGPQPARSQELINGEPFTVFTWPTAITAVKAGEYDMSVQIPTTVIVRRRAAHPRSPFGNSFFDDAFSDSFFDQFFGSATQKQIKLSSPGAKVKILSLPTENRPASFAGAVGAFDLAPAATPTRASAGDPITLKVKITGRGNFDRVSAPSLNSADDWKIYKPSAKFEAEDSAGYQGTKTFEMALVPQQSGKLEIPALEFSYFDPEPRAYVTRTTAPITIEVTAGALSRLPLAAADAAQAPAKNDPAPSATDGLAPNKLDAGSFSSTLRPWVLNPWFASAVLLPVAAMAASLTLHRRRERLANDPRRALACAASRAVRERLDAMESALRSGDAQGFFLAAREALQHRLSARLGLPAHAITLAEVHARMNGEGDGFRTFFEIADEVIYTGRTFPVADLSSWKETVQIELKKLEET
jgi:hypothetical protein